MLLSTPPCAPSPRLCATWRPSGTSVDKGGIRVHRMPSPPFPAYETVCPHRIRSDRMGFSSLWIAVSFPWESRFRPTLSPWGDLGGGAPSDPMREGWAVENPRNGQGTPTPKKVVGTPSAPQLGVHEWNASSWPTTRRRGPTDKHPRACTATNTPT